VPSQDRSDDRRHDQEFVALIPVKSPAIGKTRLAGVADRPGLARAVATDTITAAAAAALVRRVLVITDEGFAPVARSLGVEVADDPGTGLNAALRAGAAAAAARWPELRPAALLADLPALSGPVLDRALAAVGRGAAYCSDAEGTGTTLYTASYDAFDPRFGADSARAHEAGGAVPIEGDLVALRRDVDDPDGLAQAITLGVGRATAAALERSGE